MASPYVTQCIADGAVGLWTMGDASGTTCVDAKGNSNGTYTNTGGIDLTLPGIPGGLAAKGAKFTPGTGFVSVPDVAGQHVGDTFTVEAWVKLGATGSTLAIMSATNTASWLYELDNGSPSTPILEKNGTGIIVSSTSAGRISVDGLWHHVVATKATSTLHTYTDGVDVTTGASNATISNSSGINLARKGLNGTEPFNGSLAMLALYPTALSAATIAYHFHLGISEPALSATGVG